MQQYLGDIWCGGLNMRKRIIYAVVLCSLILTLTACGKKEKEENILVQPVNISIPYSETFNSAENVAIQYANYVRSEQWEYAYDLMSVPDNMLFSVNDLKSVETELLEIPEDWVLFDASNGKLTYGEKVGEAFEPDTDNYLGDLISTSYTVNLNIVNDGNSFRVGVNPAFLTSSTIAVKVPDKVQLWVGGKLLDEKARDDKGYYFISDFVNASTLTATIVSDVESKDICLHMTEEETAVAPISTADLVDVYSQTVYNGYAAFDYRWYTSRVTNEDALAWMNNNLQAVFTSISKQEDFYTGSFNSVMSKKANLEELKPLYTKATYSYADTKTKNYKDLTVVSVTPWDETSMSRKGIGFEMLNTTTMSTWVTLEYSYTIDNVTTGTTSVKTGTASGQVCLTKDNDEWKLMSIDDKILKALV